MASINIIMKAMSDKTRRDILLTLRRDGIMNAGDIAAKYEMTQATISHHLSILLEAELIEARKEGKYIYYEINTTVVQQLLGWIMSLAKVEDKKDEK